MRGYTPTQGAIDDVRAALSEFECGGPMDCVRADLIYQRYFRWHDRNGQSAGSYRLEQRQFGRTLHRAFPGIASVRFARKTGGGRRYWYRGLRWKDADSRTYVSDNHHKLDHNRAMRIRQLWGDGISVTELAAAFSVGESTIRRIIAGERWKCVNAALDGGDGQRP